MTSRFVLLGWLLLAKPDAIETRFVQVHPFPQDTAVMERTKGQERAVLLVHGLRLNPLAGAKVGQVHFHEWQKPNSPFVRALSRQADVFAFSYGQSTSLEEVSQHPALPSAIKKLAFLGYREIVLVGHSAGGVLARMLIEDQPNLPVTRVVQVSAPNLGSSWANVNLATPKDQDLFMQSLTKKERQRSLEKRADKTIPATVEFLSIVGISGQVGEFRGDGLVACQSQWPEDLQKQGIPAVRLVASHFTMLRSRQTADRVAELICTAQPRWTPDQVRDQRPAILGK